MVQDRILQHRVDTEGSVAGLADRGGGDHTPQPPWQGLLRGTGEEGLLDCQTLDSGEAM